MVGQQSFLFVVFGNNHKFELFDVRTESSLAHGFLAIKPPLRWAGFDVETDSVVIEGGSYVVQMLSLDFGVRWTPVLDFRPRIRAPITDFVIVEVELSKLKAAPCSGDIFPDPTNTTLEEFPLAALSLNYQHGRCIEAMIRYSNGRQSARRAQNARALDRELLVQLSASLEQNRLLMAVQIGRLLKTETGRSLAIRRAEQTGNRIVGERLSALFRGGPPESDIESEDESPEPPPFVRTAVVVDEEAEEVPPVIPFEFAVRPERAEVDIPVQTPEPVRTPRPVSAWDEFEEAEEEQPEGPEGKPRKRGKKGDADARKRKGKEKDKRPEKGAGKRKEKEKEKRSEKGAEKPKEKEREEPEKKGPRPRKPKIAKPRGVGSLAAFGFT
jgi:hypothetical protein